MDPATSFSSLPPELVTKICADPDLSKEDLIALRLTSKSQGIYLSASKELGKRYFKKINLVYTRYSLQAFVEICKNPAFGPAVRAVGFSYARFLPDWSVEDNKARLAELRSRRGYLDNIRLLVNRRDEEEELKNLGDAEDILAAAFTSLSHWRRPLSLTVSSSESHALGLERIWSPEYIGGDPHWACDVIGTIRLLCHAATRGTCVVQRLRVYGFVWNLVDSSCGSLSKAQLSELSLSIRVAGFPSIAQVAGLDDMVTKLLKNAVHLKTLRLENLDLDDHYYLHRPFQE
ncbi:unnamed protein product [Aureobasidium uvarum]|uniref:Uncharacterized protein n=1 Tax=Aureobasidium uvarum TaxID=2773716 RepID=A0A9N8KPK1_9PEZI|nr:unnamed protein product [Aureobasidium uvarum]